MKAVRVQVTGLVQGVGYRAWTEQEALARGLHGWVRNRRDGSVEALLAGPDPAIEDMLAQLWRGPPGSRVERVTTEPATQPERPGFQVLPTS